MSSLLLSLPELFNSYKTWISQNPRVASDYETTAKWISYFIAGRINNSHIVSELVYCLSNLLILFNDGIIKQGLRLKSDIKKLKLWLQIVEYAEVFCELSVQKLWGNTGKWIVIVSIQVFKCIARLSLIYGHNESIVENPVIPPLDRTKLGKNDNSKDFSQSELRSLSFTLKRSGRVVRKVESSPPLGLRSWKPLEGEYGRKIYKEPYECDELTRKQLLAETIYIAKPLIHLVSMGIFGSRTWKPWLISLSLDLASLQMYKSTQKSPTGLSKKQKLQLSKRTVLLLLYLIRSPFYEKQSKDKITALLTALANHVPLAKLICGPLIQYLPFWQVMEIAKPGDIEWQKLMQSFTKETGLFDFPSVRDNAPIYEKYFFRAMELIEKYPKINQMKFLLDLAETILYIEDGFQRMSSNETFKNLLSKATTEPARYIKVLNSLLMHSPGVKWVAEGHYWLDVYRIILEYQEIDGKKEIVELGLNFLTRLLKETLIQAKQFAMDLISFLSDPLIVSLKNLQSFKSASLLPFERAIFYQSIPHAKCLVKILELLLQQGNVEVLNVFLQLKVREASDRMAALSDNKEFTIILYRIEILMSLFHVSQFFDGIHVINESSLSLLGFFNIFEREIKRGNIKVVLDLAYYTLKYWRNETVHLPKHRARNSTTDIESELKSYMLMSVMFVAEVLTQNHHSRWDQFENVQSCVLYSTGREFLQNISEQGWHYGWKMYDKVSERLDENCLDSLEVLMRAKHLFSEPAVNQILQILCCLLNNVFRHFKDIVTKRVITYEEQMLIEAFFRAITLFLATPNVRTDNTLKYLDIPNVLNNYLYYISWPSTIVVKGLRLLKIVVANHMSPELMLLTDIEASSLKDLGHMLFVKLLSIDWEVQQVALSVVALLAQKAKDFPSFRAILTEASLPELVISLCLESPNPLVKEASFKCLRQMLEMKDTNIEDQIENRQVIQKVLLTVPREADATVKAEAIKFIGKAYQCFPKINEDMETHMEKAIYLLDENSEAVLEQMLIFWKTVFQHHMRSVGWSDAAFPPAIFCKKIIYMTNGEIAKRICLALSRLSDTGCLNVIEHLLKRKKFLGELFERWMLELLEVYKRYEVTEPLMKLIEQGFERNIIEYNIMEFDDTDFQDLSLCEDSFIDSTLNVRRLKPSEFVRLIYDNACKAN